ncbi:MAG: dihydrolipoamide acetyltransferase family protein, partial [Opitutaceae bacterium]
AVKSGDMLAEVETDKATMELESFFDGTLLKIFAPDGSQVELGTPLCAIGKPGEKIDAPAGKPAGQVTGDSGQGAKDSEPAGGDTKQGKTEPVPQDKDKSGTSTAAKNEVHGQPAAPTAGASKGAEPAPSTTAGEAPVRADGERIKISPLAKKLAVEKGIDPARVTGTGPGGRIVRVDIIAAEKAGTSKVRSAAPAARGAAPSTAGLLARGPIQEEKTVQVSNMRGAIARRLVESTTQLPHFYVEIEVDAAPLLGLREQLNTGLEQDGVKLSVNDFVLKGCAEALRHVPQVNGSWEGDKIRYFGAAHLSFAVALDDGLITPVIRDAHLKSIFQISTEAKSLGKSARDRKLKPDQYTGGTFCVSNLGMMGIPKFTAIINPPNAAILAVGTTVRKPVVKGDQIVIGQTMTLTLSCDHRVVDGAIGAQYLGALKTLLESPALLLI